MRMTAKAMFTLVLVVLVLGDATLARKHENQKQSEESLNKFEAGREYRFHYDAQTSTGYASSSISRQRAINRLQAHVQIVMEAPTEAVLRMRQIRTAQSSGVPAVDAWNPARLQPISSFESRLFSTEQGEENDEIREFNKQLSLPVRFQYTDEGMIGAIRFQKSESAATKNIKKAVLNLLQLNLRSISAQDNNEELEQMQNKHIIHSANRGRQMNEEWNENNFSNSYTNIENTIEGQCETTYVVSPNTMSFNGQQQHKLNVTKSINFERCNILADVTYGFQGEPILSEQQQPKHWQQQDIASSQQKMPLNSENQNMYGQVIPNVKLERSTVLRYVVNMPETGNQNVGGANQFGIERVELLSQYTADSTNSNQAMQTVAVAELTFLDSVESERPEKKNKKMNKFENGGEEKHQESLIYNADFESLEKDFMMFGDEKYQQTAKSPISPIFIGDNTNDAVEQGKKMLRNAERELDIAVSAFVLNQDDGAQGINAPETAESLWNLVNIMRMCTVSGLKQLHERSTAASKDERSANIARELFANALALAGTRNTIAFLVEMIEQHTIDQSRASQILKILGSGAGLPAPSESQVDLVLRLCNSNALQTEPVKRNCRLTIGTMVGELYQQSQNAKNLRETEAPTKPFEFVSAHKKDLYKQVLIDGLKNANEHETPYEKIVALKAIGNAGLLGTVEWVMKIIQDAEQPHDIRLHAIDALRRVFQRQAGTYGEAQTLEKVQYGLLPVFENTRERADVRMAVAAMLISNAASTNVPSKQALIDHIVYSMQNDRNEDVTAFVMQVLENLSHSSIPQQQKIGEHLKNALRVIRMPIKSKLQGSHYSRVAAPCCTENRAQSFLNFINIYNSKLVHSKYSAEYVQQRMTIPSQMAIELDTFVNGNYQRNSLQMNMIQSNFDVLLKELMSQFKYEKFDYENENSDEEQQTRDKTQKVGFFSSAAEQFTSLFRKLNIKDRQANSQVDPKNAYAFITLRNNNVDVVVVPITVEDIIAIIKGKNASGNLQKLRSSFVHAFRRISGASSELAGLMQWRTAISLNQKAARVPTSVGLPLKINYATLLFGSMGLKHEEGKEGNELLAIQPNVNYVENSYMRVWMAPSAGVSAGISWYRAFELNLPVEAEFKTSENQMQIIMNLRLPQQNIRAIGLHTLPSIFTSTKSIKQTEAVQFTKSFDSIDAATGTSIINKPIHSEQFATQQREIDTTIGSTEKMSFPFRIYGFYHMPREWSLHELNRITKTSENSIHIDFMPINGETPREIKFVLEANFYQSTIQREQNSQQQQQQNKEGYSWNAIRSRLEEFYSSFEQKFFSENNSNKFMKSGEHEEENTGRQQIAEEPKNYKEALELTHQYIKKSIEKAPSYKHSLKLNIQTIGSRRQLKANAETYAVCDSKFRVCEIRFHATRSPFFANERQQWNMEVNMQSVYPEKLNNIQELKEVSNSEKRHLKLFGAIQAQWGEPTGKKNIKMNILAEPSAQMISKALHAENQRQERLRNAQRHGLSQKHINKIEEQSSLSLFLDQIHVAAEYQLGTNEQSIVQRVFELIKTKYFWNTKTQLLNSVLQPQVQLIKASMRVNPITLRHANVSFETPTQRVHIHSLELPFAYYRFQLVAPQRKALRFTKPGSPVNKFLNNIVAYGRKLLGDELFSECIVGQESDVGQQNTIHTFNGITYTSPISKCYSVLASDCNNQGQSAYSVLAKQYGNNNQKTLKVISNYGVFEIQPTNENEQTLQVLFNGRTYTPSTATPEDLEELDRHGLVFNTNQNKNWVTIFIPSVAAIEFDGQFTHIQLSANYKNAQCGLCGHYNDNSEDVFRMNNNKLTNNIKEFHRSFTLKDESDCSNAHINEFYSQGKFALHNEENEKKSSRFDKMWQQNNRESSEETMPVEQTVVYEYNQKVCFSLKPTAQCPRGWYSFDASGEQDMLKRTKVQFTCLDRNSIEAKTLRNIVSSVGVVDMSEYPPNYSELMVLPERCIQY